MPLVISIAEAEARVTAERERCLKAVKDASLGYADGDKTAGYESAKSDIEDAIRSGK